MDLERNFKIKVTEDLKALNGEEFERFSRYILELVLNEKVVHKGQNLFAKPVGYTADFADSQYEIIGQSGTDEGYYDDFKKPLKDIESALKNHTTARTVYLFSNRYAGTSRLGDLIQEAKTKNISQEIIPFDSERISETILDKIFASHIIDDIFKYLPSSFELYKILPKTSLLPSHKDTYYERIEENEIIEKLKIKSVVQIYGLSGIGKTEITIGTAQKLLPKYQTVIWIDGDSIQNKRIDFSAIKISKFDKLVNLSTILETYSVCVIFDNINYNTSDIYDAFILHNKKNSLCLISSLTKSLDEEYTIRLDEVSDEIANKILFGGNIKLEESKCREILSYTGKHPLILRIISSAVRNKLFDWDSLIKELEDISRLTDTDRNQTISNRIIGRIKGINEKELSALNFIDNRLITQPFLEKIIGRIGVGKLLDNTIIGKDNTKHYSIHQIVLDSIKSEVTTSKWLEEFTKKVKDYLVEHNETKDIGFYNVMFNHRLLIDNILQKTKDKELKRIILYSIIQCTDIKVSAHVDSLINQITPLISDNNTYYENLLSIELAEINLFKIDKKKESDRYKEETKRSITALELLLPIAKDINHKTTIFHHIGKLYFKIGEDKTALLYFENVLKLKPNNPFALLQVARIESKAENSEKVKEITEFIFNMKDCPLSILLSFYELISFNNYSELKNKYVDEKIDEFAVKIIEAIDSRYEQPYNILSKLSSHLSYNFPSHFETIVDNLPTPANIDFNENLRFSFALILLSFYKYLKYNSGQEKMNKTFLLAKNNFELSNLDSDFKISTYVDLLIEAGEHDLAEEQANKFESENEFNYQKLSKIYRGQGKFDEAIKAANAAIAFSKLSGKKQTAYIAAFLNDRAEAENNDNRVECLNTLKEAIDKQTNNKTKNQWNTKLTDWTKKYNAINE